MAVPGVMVHGVEGARHKIVWIMFGGRMMYHGTLNRPVWSSSFPRGQFGPGLVGFAHSRSFRDFN